MQHLLHNDVSRRLLISSQYLENQISIFCRSDVFVINIKGQKRSTLSTVCMIFPAREYLEVWDWVFGQNS